MSKLGLWILTLVVLLAQASVPASAAEGSDGALVLARLGALAEEGAVAPEAAAAILFAAGPRATRNLLSHLAAPGGSRERRTAEARRVEVAIDKVPAVAVSVLGTTAIQDGDAIRVAAVSLQILAARKARPDVAGTLGDLLRKMQGRVGAASLSRSIEAVMARLASDKELDGVRLLELVRASHPGLSRSVLQGAATSLLGDAIAGCLGRGTGADGVILNQLQRAAQLGAPVDSGLVRSHVVPFLQSPTEFERSEAALVLGRVGGRAEIEPLIHALRDPSGLVRSSSHAALRQLTGMTIAGNHHRWTVWYREQVAWWDGGGASLVASLRSVPRTRLIPALASVASKRLYREEISDELVGMLRVSRPDEICAVLAALGSLRDPRALPDIIELRKHASADVRASASGALSSMRQAGIRVSASPSIALR